MRKMHQQFGARGKTSTARESSAPRMPHRITRPQSGRGTFAFSGPAPSGSPGASPASGSNQPGRWPSAGVRDGSRITSRPPLPDVRRPRSAPPGSRDGRSIHFRVDFGVSCCKQTIAPRSDRYTFASVPGVPGFPRISPPPGVAHLATSTGVSLHPSFEFPVSIRPIHHGKNNRSLG